MIRSTSQWSYSTGGRSVFVQKPDHKDQLNFKLKSGSPISIKNFNRVVGVCWEHLTKMLSKLQIFDKQF